MPLSFSVTAQLWYWEPVKKGTIPQLLPGLARLNGEQYTQNLSLKCTPQTSLSRCAFRDFHFLLCLFSTVAHFTLGKNLTIVTGIHVYV